METRKDERMSKRSVLWVTVTLLFGLSTAGIADHKPGHSPGGGGGGGEEEDGSRRITFCVDFGGHLEWDSILSDGDVSGAYQYCDGDGDVQAHTGGAKPDQTGSVLDTFVRPKDKNKGLKDRRLKLDFSLYLEDELEGSIILPAHDENGFAIVDAKFLFESSTYGALGNIPVEEGDFTTLFSIRLEDLMGVRWSLWYRPEDPSGHPAGEPGWIVRTGEFTWEISGIKAGLSQGDAFEPFAQIEMPFKMTWTDQSSVQ